MYKQHRHNYLATLALFVAVVGNPCRNLICIKSVTVTLNTQSWPNASDLAKYLNSLISTTQIIILKAATNSADWQQLPNHKRKL